MNKFVCKLHGYIVYFLTVLKLYAQNKQTAQNSCWPFAWFVTKSALKETEKEFPDCELELLSIVCLNSVTLIADFRLSTYYTYRVDQGWHIYKI